MRILVIDNFDSFTYNLVQYLGALGATSEVYRNDAITPDQVLQSAPDRVLISPGPGTPDDAGVSREVILAVAGKIPLLGVCLGHQCLAEVFGGRIVRAHPMHGKTSTIEHDEKGVFAGIRQNICVARYHSLVVDPPSISSDLVVSAKTEQGDIMGIRHRTLALEGIQFHPESFMTPEGMGMVRNFIQNGGAR
jgi:anthranilate synthase/aminodeoxychorismate synthase-like glutamine amidotransferase